MSGTFTVAGAGFWVVAGFNGCGLPVVCAGEELFPDVTVVPSVSARGFAAVGAVVVEA